MAVTMPVTAASAPQPEAGRGTSSLRDRHGGAATLKFTAAKFNLTFKLHWQSSY